MPTRQQKIKVINKVIANKELSFGCRARHKFIQNQIITIQDYKLNNYIYWIQDGTLVDSNSVLFLEEYEIIGHPVMIGDVMDFLNEKNRPYGLSLGDGDVYYAEGENATWMIDLWENKRKPIEDQSDECIDFIYDLISKQGEK